MNFKPLLFLLAIVLLMPGLLVAQLVRVQDFTPRIADTIVLERNWRTRSRIILSELEFQKGDTVTTESLSVSLKKIWNMQNFAIVDYRWDSLPDGRSVLHIAARDAFMIAPVIAGRLQAPFGSIRLGIADRNFLGRNIRLELRGQLSSMEPLFWEVRTTIPRQLLWKNMVIGAGFRREDVGDPWFISDRGYVTITNPFHKDYEFSLSPDLETGFIRHQSSRDLAEPFSRGFWYFRLGESIGTVTHRRHQEEGFNVTGMLGAGIGLNNGTMNYLEGSIRAEYHQLINSKLQFSARWEGRYTSTVYESLWTRYGPGNIRGIEYGDLSGPLMQLASTGLYYTWLNCDYLAMEQSVFVQYAAAMVNAGDWSSVKRHYAIGTGFQFTIPMYPAASLLLTFSFNPNRKNWFYLEL
jgi:hypothetical protein